MLHIIKVAFFLMDEAAECYQQTFLAENLIIIGGVFFQDGRSQLTRFSETVNIKSKNDSYAKACSIGQRAKTQWNEGNG